MDYDFFLFSRLSIYANGLFHFDDRRKNVPSQYLFLQIRLSHKLVIE